MGNRERRVGGARDLVRRVAGAGGALVALTASACGSSHASSQSFAARLCPVVRGWNDESVDTVNKFSDDSVKLASATDRRRLYDTAWGRLGELVDQAAADAKRLPAAPKDPAAVRGLLTDAFTRMRTTVDTGRHDAAGLPDTAYEYASVRDGTLFTSVEKNQAILYGTVLQLVERGVAPQGCGQRAPVDLSPTQTLPK